MHIDKQKLLSVLICSHPNRMPLLQRMLFQLKRQLTKETEIIVDLCTDPMVRGSVRNSLIDKANGKYCAFVDDDDIVSDYYIKRIVHALKNNPDICSITGCVTSLWNNERRTFVLSTQYKPIFSLPDANHENGLYNRYSSHLCPVKTEIIRTVRFPEDMRNEDNGYSDRLKKYEGELKEVAIEGTIYYYFSRILLG
jgi:glycosyltransferase involved in cell wall biosynthesis